jgi:hypothetical protein
MTSLYKALTGREFGDDKSKDELKTESLLKFVSDDSLRKKEDPATYRKRLEYIKEMIEERIHASEEMDGDG